MRAAPTPKFAQVKLWNLTTGEEVSLPELDPKMSSMCGAYSPNGRFFVHAAADRMIAVRDAKTREVAFHLRGHADEVAALAFAQDGKRLASAGADRSVRVWSLQRPPEARVFSAVTSAQHLHFSADSKLLAIAGREFTRFPSAAILWDLRADTIHNLLGAAGGKPLQPAVFPGMLLLSTIDNVAMHPSGKELAIGWSNGSAVVVNVDTRKSTSLATESSLPQQVAYSPDGARLATATSHPSSGLTALPRATGSAIAVKIWDTADGRLLHTLRGHTAVSFSPDGAFVATAGDRNAVWVWDVVSGKERHVLEGHPELVVKVAYSTSGRLLSVCPKKAVVWDPAGGKMRFSVSGLGRVVAISPDGKRLASGTNLGLVNIWDVDLGIEIVSLQVHAGRISSIAFSPDGDALAVGTNQEAGKVAVKVLQARQMP